MPAFAAGLCFAALVLGCSASRAYEASSLDSHDLASLIGLQHGMSQPLSATALLRHLESTVSSRGAVPQPVDGSASLFWLSRRANLTMLMGTSRDSGAVPAAGAGLQLNMVSKREPVDIPLVELSEAEIGRDGGGRIMASWTTIRNSEAADYYGVPLTSVPVRGLLIAWADTARQPVLVIAPDLLPAGCRDPSSRLAGAGHSALLEAEASMHQAWRSGRGAGARAPPAQASVATAGAAAAAPGEASSSDSTACELPGMPETRSILGSSGSSSGGSSSAMPAGKSAKLRHHEAMTIMRQELALAALAPYHASRRQPPRKLLAAAEESLAVTASTARALASAPGAHPLRRVLYGRRHGVNNDADSARVETARRLRQLYVVPGYSRGTRRVLAVRFKFFGQLDTDVATDAALRPMMTDVVSELNKAAMGVATFSFVMPTNTFTFSQSTGTCNGDYTVLDSDGRAIVQSVTGIDTTTYEHFVIMLPSCNFVWAGLAYVGGGSAWINGATSSYQNVVIHELGHNLGLGHASSRDPLLGTWIEYSNEYDYMVSALPHSRAELSSSGALDFDMRVLSSTRCLLWLRCSGDACYQDTNLTQIPPSHRLRVRHRYILFVSTANLAAGVGRQRLHIPRLRLGLRPGHGLAA